MDMVKSYKKPSFLTLKVRLNLTQSREMIYQVLILYYFDLK